jgi:hypothetical protein
MLALELSAVPSRKLQDFKEIGKLLGNFFGIYCSEDILRKSLTLFNKCLFVLVQKKRIS